MNHKFRLKDEKKKGEEVKGEEGRRLAAVRWEKKEMREEKEMRKI